MSWNPNQGQNPNQQPPPYTGYPPQQDNPYGGQQYGYGQQPPQQPYGGQYQQQQYQQPYGNPAYGAAPNVGPLGPSTANMDPKTAAGVSYILTWLTGLIIFLMEKQNRFVRFHALQAILLGVGASVLSIAFYIVFIILVIVAAAANSSVLAGLFSLIGVLGFLAIAVGSFIGWLLGMINAFQGKYIKLPIIGNWAERGAGPSV